MGREASPPADHNNVSRFPDKQTHRLHQDRFHAARCRVTVTGAGLAWVSDRAQVLSPGTLRLLVAHLPSSLAAVVQDRLVASSPVTRLSLPRSERERIIRLSVAHVQALAQAMPTRSTTMVITYAGLGLRIAELLALRVQDVDFLRRAVRSEWQLSPDRKPPDSTHNTKITTDVGVAERGRRVPLRQGQKVRRESLADVAGKRAPLCRSRLPHRRLQAPRSRLSPSRLDFPTVRRPRRDSNARHPL